MLCVVLNELVVPGACESVVTLGTVVPEASPRILNPEVGMPCE